MALWTFCGARFGDMFVLAAERGRLCHLRHGLECFSAVPRPEAEFPGTCLGTLVWIAAVMTLRPTQGGAAYDRRRHRRLYAALTAAELWTERRRALRKRWPSVAVPVSMASC